MPHWLRKSLAVLSFVKFFVSGLILGTLVFPIVWLVTWPRARFRRVCGRMIQASFPLFLFWMRLAGLIGYRSRAVGLPEGFPRDRGYVLVCNHPTLIDTIFMLAWFRDLTCVVKSSWFNSPFFGLLMRSTNYIPGPGATGDEDTETPVLDRMVEHLRGGHPVLVFPEGTRAPPGEMLRFRRGSFEAAVQAGVPILPVFIGASPAGLTKGIPLVPDGRIDYTFEVLPWVDPATEDVSSHELRDRYAALFAERHRRFYDAHPAFPASATPHLSQGTDLSS